jgi:hypothetical protein
MRKIKLSIVQVKREYNLVVIEVTKKCEWLVRIKITKEDVKQLELIGVKLKKK